MAADVGVPVRNRQAAVPVALPLAASWQQGVFRDSIGVITRSIDPGSDWPANRLTSGLGSNVSMWLGPPSMNRKITLRAGVRLCPDRATIDSAAPLSEAINAPRASPPKPAPERSRKSRREFVDSW